ncbi:hypothetical protein Airi01_049540 [Actinoallomurus iriomotensis]|uniref:Beta-lactamase-related domain-containing protein n=1 Tax=Actinoallomurus iriomotensis TaxID=478107 RepID=A0A9W6VRN6_9ACTN|nr:hypothetical protein Airi01_049540 [Actinoallomurus iriomotensis]
MIERAGLRHTYFRTPTGTTMTPKAALTTSPTRIRPRGWAAGQIISAPRDVNRLFSALLVGRPPPAAQLKQMRTTVPAPAPGNGVRYGLGLTSTPLTCGGVAWGHGGDFPGYHASDAVTTDGRAATIAVTELSGSPARPQHLTTDIDTALRQ